jgi:hypothetical protein
MPVWREKPKEVSTDFPFSMAQREPLPPRWQEMSLYVSPAFAAICRAIYPWLAP